LEKGNSSGGGERSEKTSSRRRKESPQVYSKKGEGKIGGVASVSEWVTQGTVLGRGVLDSLKGD